MDDSAQPCSPEIVRVILDFDGCLDWNEILVESSIKDTESTQPFHERFSYYANRIIKCIAANPFMQDYLTKLSNKKIVVPESVRTVIDDLETMVENS